ncbi:MAG: carboxypeptidase regulatory-like domain-containing protein [Corallincola sp.]|nr:carboxypeptidase regulatory-like domain-containing protein [Corallincola sp.]
MSLSLTLLRAAFAAWLLLLLPACEVNADMFGLFAKKYDVHLSPAVSGRLTKDGQPLAGVKVVRDLNYDKSFIDSTTTDADGKFSFPAKSIRSSLPGGMFTADTRVIQTINAEFFGIKYLLWDTGQHGIKENPELTLRLQQLSCELTEKEMLYYVPNPQSKSGREHSIATICRWPFGPEPIDPDSL